MEMVWGQTVLSHTGLLVVFPHPQEPAAQSYEQTPWLLTLL